MKWVDSFVSCEFCISSDTAANSDKERDDAKSEGEHMPPAPIVANSKPDNAPRRQPYQKPDGNVITLDGRMPEPWSKPSKNNQNSDRNADGSSPKLAARPPDGLMINRESKESGIFGPFRLTTGVLFQSLVVR